MPAARLSKAAAAIDPKLPEELGIPEPTAPDAPKQPADKRSKRR